MERLTEVEVPHGERLERSPELAPHKVAGLVDIRGGQLYLVPASK